ncbi:MULTISPECIES: hypothetical protein [unclassified Ectothiorhodospira]|uniref:hypothetical protein n=1 Tax=unclassified Ectothiorhodospira TaxID=2684909 RepID=UPI001EE89975|nr:MULTISPECIES: hypothetical protein [unclassified Ectothiorhodospira]MCG5516259.1 hypothetical protein [Ectothiorhodospira sp. 9100]MCG5518068.1 hypothetical protein [Ectothiorhodospira sp. 9905]
MEVPLERENNEFSINSIKKRARKAAERAKKNQNAKVIGNSTVIVYYNKSEKTAIREKKSIHAFLQKNSKE